MTVVFGKMSCLLWKFFINCPCTECDKIIYYLETRCGVAVLRAMLTLYYLSLLLFFAMIMLNIFGILRYIIIYRGKTLNGKVNSKKNKEIKKCKAEIISLILFRTDTLKFSRKLHMLGFRLVSHEKANI